VTVTLEVTAAIAGVHHSTSRRTGVRGVLAVPAVSQARRVCLQPATASPSREEEVR
jgi:hypothetical protein